MDLKFNDDVLVDFCGKELKGKIADNFQGDQWIVDITGEDGQSHSEIVSVENIYKIPKQPSLDDYDFEDR